MECTCAAGRFVAGAALAMLAACNVPDGFYGQTLPEAAAMPVIRTQPQAQAAVRGGPVTFTVDGSAPGSVTYQWRRNGVELPGETGTALVVPSAGADDDHAQYTVVVGNAFASVMSEPAELRVAPGLPPVRAVSGRATAP